MNIMADETEKKKVKKSGKKSDSNSKVIIENEKDIAMEFATLVHKKFDRIVKATVLFGSQAKNTATAGSDIDIIIIVDDASLKWDLELIAWYREELGKIIDSYKFNRELHINTIKLTTWWNDLLHGDPVVINILRYGEVLIDSGGFFVPLKALLHQGKIRATHEAVYTALQRSPSHLARSKASKLGGVEGVYWSMVDAAQAALMITGRLPPSPEHIPIMLRETFVSSNMLKSKYIDSIKEIIAIHKSVVHGDIHEISGKSLDEWQEKAEEFLREMTSLIDKVLESEKK